MAVTIDIKALFRTVVAPEFAAKTDGEIELFQSEAEIEISEKKFLSRYPRAVALMTAHLMVMSDRSIAKKASSGQGPLKKTKVGQLEREFAVSTSDKSNESILLTDYGKEFIRLRKQVLKGPLFVSC